MSPKKPHILISESGNINNSPDISQVIKVDLDSQTINLSQIGSGSINEVLLHQQNEIDLLKNQVQNLTEFLSGMAGAFEKMSETQVVLTGTVTNLLVSQENFIQALTNNHIELNEVKGGIDELLRRLPPPVDDFQSKP